MRFEQSDYNISARNNEYYKVLSTIKVRIEEMRIEGYPTDVLENLYRDLIKSEGTNVPPHYYDTIINLLLFYVPEEVKDKY